MTTETERRTIAREDYYKLIGLLALAREHNRSLRIIERAAAGITGEPDDDISGTGYFGCTSDALYNDESADELLRKLGIAVEDE